MYIPLIIALAIIDFVCVIISGSEVFRSIRAGSYNYQIVKLDIVRILVIIFSSATSILNMTRIYTDGSIGSNHFVYISYNYCYIISESFLYNYLVFRIYRFEMKSFNSILVKWNIVATSVLVLNLTIAFILNLDRTNSTLLLVYQVIYSVAILSWDLLALIAFSYILFKLRRTNRDLNVRIMLICYISVCFLKIAMFIVQDTSISKYHLIDYYALLNLINATNKLYVTLPQMISRYYQVKSDSKNTLINLNDSDSVMHNLADSNIIDVGTFTSRPP